MISSPARPKKGRTATLESYHSLQVQMINKIMEENSTCADCGGAGSGWICLNFGTFLCIDCTFIHKEYLSDVTILVKASEHTFSTAELQYLQKMGNKFANQILEAKSSEKKPSPISKREEKVRWCTQKYHKIFCIQSFPEFVDSAKRLDHTVSISNFKLKSSGPQADTDESKQARSQVIQEILQTERVYVQNMKILVEIFINPLRTDEVAKQFLTEEKFKSIFGEIEVLLSYNSVFLESLEKLYDKTHPENSNFGEAFLKIVGFLKIYATYINYYSRSQTTLKNVSMESKAFQQWLYERSRLEKCDKKSLEAFLIAPIQRVPRYVLLLENLIKNTPVTHHEYITLCKALEKIQELANYLNEKKREVENIEKIIELKGRFIEQKGNKFHFPVDSSSRLIREDLIQIFSKKQLKERIFFMFNDKLICAKSTLTKGKKMLKLKDMLDYTFVKLLEPTDDEIVNLPPNSFQLIHRYGAILYTLVFQDLDVKKTWITDFNSMKDSVDQNQKTKFKNAQEKLKITKDALVEQYLGGGDLSKFRISNPRKGRRSSNSNQRYYKIHKLCLIGGKKSGKTSFVQKFVNNKWEEVFEDLHQTIPESMFQKNFDSQTILQILDTPDDPKHKLLDHQILWAEGIIYIFKLNDKQTFQNIYDYRKQIIRLRGFNLPCILIGTAKDCQRTVSEEETKSLSELLNCSYFEVCSKTGEGIEEGLIFLLSEVQSTKTRIQQYQGKITSSVNGIVTRNRSSTLGNVSTKVINLKKLKSSKTLPTKKDKKPEGSRIEKTDDLFNNPRFSDVVLVTKNGEEFFGHKSLLCLKNTYFRLFFQEENYLEAARVALKDASTPTFPILLELLYRNSIDLVAHIPTANEEAEREFFEELFRCAKIYQIESITHEVKKILQHSNALTIGEAAQKVGHEEIINVCFTFIVDNYDCYEFLTSFHSASEFYKALAHAPPYVGLTNSWKITLDKAVEHGEGKYVRYVLNKIVEQFEGIKIAFGPVYYEVGELLDSGFLLHKAASLGHLQVAKILIEFGANVNLMDDKQKTPLQIATQNTHMQIASLLIENGSRLNEHLIESKDKFSTI